MPLTLAPETRRSYTVPLVVAALALLAVFAALFYFNPHRQAELHAAHTDIFAPQTTFQQLPTRGAIHIVGAAPQVEQDLYAVVTVQVKDDLRLPLFVDEVDAKYRAADGSEADAVAPAAADLARVEQIFPQLKPLLPHPLLLGDTVPPKGSAEGQVLLHFPHLTAKDWQARKPSTLTVHFLHQDPITVDIP